MLSTPPRERNESPDTPRSSKKKSRLGRFNLKRTKSARKERDQSPSGLTLPPELQLAPNPLREGYRSDSRLPVAAAPRLAEVAAGGSAARPASPLPGTSGYWSADSALVAVPDALDDTPVGSEAELEHGGVAGKKRSKRQRLTSLLRGNFKRAGPTRRHALTTGAAALEDSLHNSGAGSGVGLPDGPRALSLETEPVAPVPLSVGAALEASGDALEQRSSIDVAARSYDSDITPTRPRGRRRHHRRLGRRPRNSQSPEGGAATAAAPARKRGGAGKGPAPPALALSTTTSSTAASAVGGSSDGGKSGSGGDGRIRAGSTYLSHDAALPLEQCPWHSWRDGDAADFHVRTRGYKRTAIKAPSAPAFFELVGMDAFASPCKVDHVASRIAGLSELAAGARSGHPDVPALLVVNAQLPNEGPSFGGRGDGCTMHVLMYFKATERLRAAMEALLLAAPAQAAAAAAPAEEEGNGAGADAAAAAPKTASDEETVAAARLLAEWFRRAPTDDDFRGRWKAWGILANEADLGLPGFCRKFNGKPILVYGRESTVYKGADYVEVDVCAHMFSYVGRKGLWSVQHKWPNAILRLGFCIEGRADDELPERLLGCACLKGLDISRVPSLCLSPSGASLVPYGAKSCAKGAAAGKMGEAGDSAEAINGAAVRSPENGGSQAVVGSRRRAACQVVVMLAHEGGMFVVVLAVLTALLLSQSLAAGSGHKAL